jgi:hypothetical protein
MENELVHMVSSYNTACHLSQLIFLIFLACLMCRTTELETEAADLQGIAAVTKQTSL